MCGNASELRYVGMGPGKRCLFFLTALLPWNQITWRYGCGVGKASPCGVSGALMTTLEILRESIICTLDRTHNRIRSPR